jgi:peroxiredoxin
VPTGANVPAVGAKAPDFTLPDANRKPVALAQLLGAPQSKGVLLIFYRGYW